MFDLLPTTKCLKGKEIRIITDSMYIKKRVWYPSTHYVNMVKDLQLVNFVLTPCFPYLSFNTLIVE